MLSQENYDEQTATDTETTTAISKDLVATAQTPSEKRSWICPLENFFFTEERYYLVMPFIEGATLSNLRKHCITEPEYKGKERFSESLTRFYIL
mgnify:CR=1 FL=1